MRTGRVRKLDSDSTTIRKMVRKEIVLSSPPNRTRSDNFVRNYAFSSSGGSGFGGGGSTGTGGSSFKADAYQPGTPGILVSVTRTKIKAEHGAYLSDDVDDDAVRIVADAVNDPIYWLGVR